MIEKIFNLGYDLGMEFVKKYLFVVVIKNPEDHSWGDEEIDLIKDMKFSIELHSVDIKSFEVDWSVLFQRGKKNYMGCGKFYEYEFEENGVDIDEIYEEFKLKNFLK